VIETADVACLAGCDLFRGPVLLDIVIVVRSVRLQVVILRKSHMQYLRQ